MKLYFGLALLALFYIPAIFCQKEEDAKISELTPECNQIREKLTKNMNILENVANTASGIQQKDCNFAKNNVKLTKKYGKCLPSDAQDGMDKVYKNMRFVSRIICENVNKRILGCFSPENLKQFNQCTNKTIQYIDFMAKQKPKTTTNLNEADKSQIRKKRFLLKNLFDRDDASDGTQGRFGKQYGGNIGGNIPGFSLLSDLTENLSSGLTGLISKRSSRGSKSLTPLEQQCCMVHIQSDCFLSKVLHTCAEKSELRLYKAFQTVLSLAVRDVVEIACGRIEKLDQCEKFSTTWDAEQDLGFRR